MARRLAVQFCIDMLTIAAISVAAVVGISMVCSLLGWPLIPDSTERVYSLRDGTRLVAMNDAESDKIIRDHGTEIRGIAMQSPGLPGGNLAFSVAMASFLTAIVYVAVRRRKQLRDWFRFSPQILAKGVAFGVLFILLGTGYEYLVDITPVPSSELIEAWMQILTNSKAMIFIAVVMAPLAEELYFRGYLFEQLSDWRGPRVAVWGTACAFALLHMSIAFLPVYLLFGLLFAWLRRNTGGLTAPVLAHALTNAAAVCLN